MSSESILEELINDLVEDDSEEDNDNDEEYDENEKLIDIDFSNTEITSKLTNLLTDALWQQISRLLPSNILEELLKEAASNYCSEIKNIPKW